jgi:hypothetical protein
MPITVEAIADKQQITKRISVLILLLRVEKASIMTISFFGCGSRQWLPNGWRYRQGRDLADKATRRRTCRWCRSPESAGSRPHLSGARGVGQVLQDGFEFGTDVIRWAVENNS